MVQRNTIQKALIHEAVLRMGCHPTADEVYQEVAKAHPNISRGTVYRNLNQLAQAGKILRVQVANAPDRYDHCSQEHGHFHCLCCGQVFDYQLKSPPRPDPRRNPDLQVTGCAVLFSGYCGRCRRQKTGQGA